ncbi:MFS transporter, partial [uncultured Ruminococcus sp.]|uniref:MFS transporter n=1 Tax=uncultured Ruminococcus sp. TaxID=165186 RepID=UPI002803CA2F
MYLLLLAVIYIAFISLGLPDSLLGAAWPTIRVDFDVPLSYMGLVSMIIAGGTIISGLLSERLTKKFGTRTVTIVSVFLTAAALLGFSTTHAFYQLCLWGIPYGLGAGAIDAALNNYVALHYNSRHMSWLHCFWGVGTIISPYIMSYALTHSTWNHGYRMVSYLQFAIVVILLLSIPLWNIHKQSHQEQQKAPVLGIKGALKIKGVPTLLIGFFAYCAAEATTMLWASSYLEGTRGISKDKAAAFGSLFFIGITVGRFLSGFISEKFGDNRMIRLGTGIALCGVCCIVIPNPIVSMIGFIIIGLGCAPVYPCIIHSTPYNFGAENSQGIIGIQMASAYVGSTFMPPIFGLIANHISL